VPATRSPDILYMVTRSSDTQQTVTRFSNTHHIHFAEVMLGTQVGNHFVGQLHRLTVLGNRSAELRALHCSRVGQYKAGYTVPKVQCP
jgi:hypothetical protein